MEFSQQIQEEVRTRQQGKCGLCGVNIFEQENQENYFYQILPSHYGGDFDLDNCVLLCSECSTVVLNTDKFKDPLAISIHDFGSANLQSDPLEKYLLAYNNLKTEIDNCLNMAFNNNDWKAISSRIRDAREVLKNPFLKAEHYEPLIDKLDAATEEMNRRQTEERETLERECNANYERIKAKIDDAVEFMKDSLSLRETKEKFIAAQYEFKSLKLFKEQRDEQHARLQAVFDEIHIRQAEQRESYQMECIENYHNIKAGVDEAVEFARTSPSFKKAREVLINVQKDFKGLRLNKDQREEQYSRLQAAFEDLNTRQDEERNAFEKECAENYEMLRAVVEKAIATTDGDDIDTRAAREALIDAQSQFKGLKLKRDHRELLYQKLQNAFEDLNQKQKEEWGSFEVECNENYHEAINEIEVINVNLNNSPIFNDIRQSLIDVQSGVKSMKLLRQQRNDLFKRIRETFALLDERRREYLEKRNIEKRGKLESIIENLQRKIERIEESITKDEESLKIQHEKLSQVRSGDREDERRAEINEKIELIAVRIREKQANTDELKSRVENINKEILEL